MTDIIIKGAMIGDFNVGKSSISQRYVRGDTEHNPTIGIDFHSKDILYEGYNVRLHLWDTAGQERFRSIVKVYARNIYVFFLVIDVTRRSSFNHLGYWQTFIKENSNADQQVQIVLLVNKVDTPPAQWTFSRQEIKAYMKFHTAISSVHYVSTHKTVRSISDYTPIHDVFTTAVQTACQTLLQSIHPIKGIVDRRTQTAELGTPPDSPPSQPPTSAEVMTSLGFKQSPVRTQLCFSVQDQYSNCPC